MQNKDIETQLIVVQEAMKRIEQRMDEGFLHMNKS